MYFLNPLTFLNHNAKLNPNLKSDPNDRGILIYKEAYSCVHILRATKFSLTLECKWFHIQSFYNV